MFSRIKNYIYIGLAAMAAWSCGGTPHWTVEGRIEGADGQVMTVEANDNGRWYAIDSVALDASGKFSIEHAPSGYPDIYRLRLGDKSLYFPIDSIETVTVLTTASAFDSDYMLSGSQSAEKLMEVDRRVAESMMRLGVGGVVNDSLLKRDLGGLLLQDPSGIVSYYIINKSIGGLQLFDPSKPSDLKIIGAVANAYDRYRPADPRTGYLRSLYLRNRPLPARTAAPADTIEAQVVNLIDITLYDNKGVKRSLSALAREGKVILLNFTAYSADESAAFNRELNRVYEKYHRQGLEIFQVSVDDDEYFWRQAAGPLPWITVYNSRAEGTGFLTSYNVGVLPTTFIIDRKGDLVARVESLDSLEREIAKRL